MRRDPKAVLAALEMDADRRELYVEGSRDRQLILWLLGDSGDRDSVVQDISGVDMPRVQGGNRGRLMAFARRMAGVDRVRYFGDADYDRLLGRPVPANGWLTDGRDMESYLLLSRCANKAIRVGLNRPAAETTSSVRQVVAASRRTAYLRVADVRNGWALPFQTTPPSRKAEVRGQMLEFDERSWATALVDASIGRRFLSSVLEGWEAAATEFASAPDQELIHGKDFLDLLGEFLLHHGVERRTCPSLIWSALERGSVARQPNVAQVLKYVAA